MKILSVIIILIYTWFTHWQFLLKDGPFPNPAGMALLSTIISSAYLVQALCIAYYWRIFTTYDIYYKIYSFIIIPILFLLMQIVVLDSVGVHNTYNNTSIWVIGFILVVIFIHPLMLVVGEDMLPHVEPEAQLTWTKKFPPERFEDMHRGFFFLLGLFAIPFILSLLYQ